MKAVLDARDNFVSDSDRLRQQYGKIITDNMTDQRDKYKEILEGIAEHSKDLARARQIEQDLKDLLENLRRTAEDKVHDKIQAQAELERELDEIQAKIKAQEQELRKLADQAGNLEDDIAAKRADLRNKERDTIRDDLAGEERELCSETDRRLELELKLQNLKQAYAKQLQDKQISEADDMAEQE